MVVLKILVIIAIPVSLLIIHRTITYLIEFWGHTLRATCLEAAFTKQELRQIVTACAEFAHLAYPVHGSGSRHGVYSPELAHSIKQKLRVMCQLRDVDFDLYWNEE